MPEYADPGQLRALRPVRPGQHQGRLPVPLTHRSVLDRSILARPTLEAGRALLGSLLVRDDDTGRRTGRIVEVEAYIGQEDLASHARFGETNRNRVMFGRPGVAYVYLVYGMHACLNVVTEPEGSPAALLVRAVEPLDGIARMRTDRIARATSNRRMTPPDVAAADAQRISLVPAVRLASGPGLVAAAFGLDTGWTGTDLCDPASPLRLEAAPEGAAADTEAPRAIVATVRIGIGYAGEPWTTNPWRLSLAGHPSVSGPPGAR